MFTNKNVNNFYLSFFIYTYSGLSFSFLFFLYFLHTVWTFEPYKTRKEKVPNYFLSVLTIYTILAWVSLFSFSLFSPHSLNYWALFLLTITYYQLLSFTFYFLLHILWTFELYNRKNFVWETFNDLSKFKTLKH